MEVSYDKLIELIEMGLLSLAIFSLAIIKLISFCDKKKDKQRTIRTFQRTSRI